VSPAGSGTATPSDSGTATALAPPVDAPVAVAGAVVGGLVAAIVVGAVLAAVAVILLPAIAIWRRAAPRARLKSRLVSTRVLGGRVRVGEAVPVVVQQR
jgi:uncharacterized iron-regulated membrane protein